MTTESGQRQVASRIEVCFQRLRSAPAKRDLLVVTRRVEVECWPPAKLAATSDVHNGGRQPKLTEYLAEQKCMSNYSLEPVQNGARSPETEVRMSNEIQSLRCIGSM